MNLTKIPWGNGTRRRNLYSSGAHRVRHAIGLGDHPGHRTDTDQTDVLFTHVARDTFFVHRLGIAVNQDYFVARWSERLQ
jgi:hypothetical protein